MEDCDWTDLPSTSSGLLGIDENYITDSSPEISGKKEDLPEHENESDSANNTENNSSEDCEVGGKVTKKASSNEKQEKESCPICLSSFEDRSFLDQCFHSFCFCCILQWCEVVQTCPLCKAGFASVIHNVKSMQNYEQYIVEKKTKSEQASNNVRHAESYDGRGFNEHGQRFRYRTTRSLRNNSENNNTRSETQQHPEVTLHPAASRQSRSEGWGNEATTRRRSRHTRTRIRGIDKRRQVYSFNLRATSRLERGKQRSRSISSQFFKTYQGCTHRLIPWLARDLTVLLGNNEEEVNFLMEFILSLITKIDMDSAEFLEELRPFLLQTTEHFVHELLSFAKAPFDMTSYDECVVYPWPEESFRAAIIRDGDNMNEEREGHSSPVVCIQSISESTPLSRCAWSDTPAGLHQVSRVQDSPIPHGESLRPVEVNQVIEISDSNEGSERMDESKKPTEYSQNIVTEEYGENSERVQSSPNDCHISLTRASVSEAVQSDNSAEREELFTSEKHKTDGAEHVHRHIHKHVHKHTHKHRHEHKHKYRSKHKHKNEHEHKHKRKHKHRDEYEHKRHDVTNDDLSVGEALSCVSRSAVDYATQVGHSEIQTNNVGQVHSPKLEEMRKEIDELNVLIQQHEEQLLSLNRRTES